MAVRESVRQVVLALVIFLAALYLPRWDASNLEVPHAMSVASAQAVLSAIASGMIALTAIVFSLSFVTLQMAASAYSPRLAPVLIRDPFLFRALGVFVATFAYALGTLAATDLHASGIVPQDSIIVVALLLGGSMAMLVRLIQRLSRLQIYEVLENVAVCGRRIIARLPEIDVANGSPAARIDGSPVGRVVRYRGDRPLYVIAVNERKIEELASRSGVGIELVAAIGDCMTYGAEVARIRGNATAVSEAEILAALRLAPERRMQSDLAYDLHLIVDTGVRALSPAINDPSTAVQVIDKLEDLLSRLSGRALPPGQSWIGFLELSFDELRLCSGSQPSVYRRMRAAVQVIAAVCSQEARRAQTLAYLSRLDASIKRAGFDDDDLRSAQTADRQGVGLAGEGVS